MILTEYINIGPPAGVTTTWSFKVMFMPFSNLFTSNTRMTWDRSTGTTTAPVASVAVYGQFNVWKWRDEDPEPNIILDAPAHTIILDPSNGWSHLRLTHAGFEAINTSADLYRGGMYYGFRSPLMQDDAFVAYSGTSGQPANNTFARLFTVCGYPNGLSDIINLSTTVSGAARDGVGVFSLPMSSENPFTFTAPTNILLLDDISSAAAVNGRFPSVGLSSPYRWMPCGAYVTGLATQASFQLKARVGYELMPGADASRAYQAMAHKPVPRSFLVSEMLDQLLANTPAGFDYKENPFGEWMGRILEGLSAVVPSIASFIPHPAAKVVGAIAAPALNQAGRALQGKTINKTKVTVKSKPPKVKRA